MFPQIREHFRQHQIEPLFVLIELPVANKRDRLGLGGRVAARRHRRAGGQETDMQGEIHRLLMRHQEHRRRRGNRARALRQGNVALLVIDHERDGRPRGAGANTRDASIWPRVLPIRTRPVWMLRIENKHLWRALRQWPRHDWDLRLRQNIVAS